MERNDLALIDANRKTNYDLDRVYKDHMALGNKIDRLESAKALGPNEEQELHDMKKEKLGLRENLEKILDGLR